MFALFTCDTKELVNIQAEFRLYLVTIRTSSFVQFSWCISNFQYDCGLNLTLNSINRNLFWICRQWPHWISYYLIEIVSLIITKSKKPAQISMIYDHLNGSVDVDKFWSVKNIIGCDLNNLKLIYWYSIYIHHLFSMVWCAYSNELCLS